MSRFWGVILLLVLICLSLHSLRLYFDESSGKGEEKSLKVLTYPSFISGPGPQLANEFYKQTGIRVEFINAHSAGLILHRLKSHSRESYDVVMGVDQWSVSEVPQSQLYDLANFKKTLAFVEPLKRQASAQDYFVPYNFSPLSFLVKAPGDQDLEFESLKDLFTKVDKIVIQDPRTSSLGLSFLSWLSEEDYKAFLTQREKVKVLPSWSSSYQVFERSPSVIVFTFLSSLYYHWLDKDEREVKAFSSKKAHPQHIEYLFVQQNANSDQSLLWVQFIMSPSSQSLIAKLNYMLPVIAIDASERRPIQLPYLSSDVLSERSEVLHRLQLWKAEGI